MTWSLLIFFLPHQFDNISNRRAHFETTGPEIWQQTEGRVDAVTFSTGTGGTIAGEQQTQWPLLTTSVLKITTLFLPNKNSVAFIYFNYSWNSPQWPLWGRKKVASVQRCKQESMYGLRTKKIGYVWRFDCMSLIQPPNYYYHLRSWVIIFFTILPH